MNGIDIGLTIIEDFITLDEEFMILEIIEDKNIIEAKNRSRNSIKRYGSSAPYPSSVVSETIPDHLMSLVLKIQEQNITSSIIDSVSINEYLAGQEITPHIDSKKSGKTIVVLSLMSNAQMKFEHKKDSFICDIKNRSLVVMKNEIRDKWMHSILPVKKKRYSIVFRCSKEI